MNRLVLTAQVAERGAMRYTPAGLPALDLGLAHESVVEQGGHARKVSLKLPALAIGPIADALAGQTVGFEGVFTGFLGARRNGRGVLFHLTAIEPAGSKDGKLQPSH
jgi:primosomal replication protein N